MTLRKLPALDYEFLFVVRSTFNPAIFFVFDGLRL